MSSAFTWPFDFFMLFRFSLRFRPKEEPQFGFWQLGAMRSARQQGAAYQPSMLVFQGFEDASKEFRSVLNATLKPALISVSITGAGRFMVMPLSKSSVETSRSPPPNPLCFQGFSPYPG